MRTMLTTSDLFSDGSVLDYLNGHAPRSHYTGNPLSLTDLSHWTGIGPTLKREGPIIMEWENSMDPEWWYGQQDGIYTHQIRRAISDEELTAAALAAGYAGEQIREALSQREAEAAANRAHWEAERQKLRDAERERHEANQRYLAEQNALMPPGWEMQEKKGKGILLNGRTLGTWRKAGFTICWNTGSFAIDRAGQRLKTGFATAAEAAAEAERMMEA